MKVYLASIRILAGRTVTQLFVGKPTREELIDIFYNHGKDVAAVVENMGPFFTLYDYVNDCGFPLKEVQFKCMKAYYNVLGTRVAEVVLVELGDSVLTAEGVTSFLGD